MFKCYHRCHHSTETVLLKVRNNILLNMNKQHVTILVLLDLSAAFNTVHHEILLESMTSKLSIGGTVLISLLFISSVAAGSCWSQAIEIIPAWLWRSARVLSWAAVIAAVYLKSLRLTYLKLIPMQIYSQLYLSFSPGNSLCQDATVTAMEACIADIKKWTQ